MRNKYFTFVLLCFLSFLLYGQEPVYFNERIDNFNNSDNSRNIISLEDGYLVFGLSEDTIYNYFFQYSFSKISLEGNLEWIKTYGDTINDYLEGQPGSIIKYNENKYFTCGYKSIWTGTEVSYCGYLMCLDNKFDTLWSKSYCQDALPYDTTYVLHQLKKCNDGGLVFAGVFLTETSYSKVWLLKTDSLGNKQWEKFFGDGTMRFAGYSVIQTTDGGYAIGAFNYKPGDDNSGDPLIIKTDSLGNEEWTLNPGTQYLDNKAMLALSHDGYIIAATNYATKPYGDNRKAKNQLLKIRNDGALIFNRIIGDSKYDNFLNQVRVLKNGEIVTTGIYRSFDSSMPSFLGWILCVNSNGIQKWYREYMNLTGENSTNYLRDIIQTNDSGFIACGQVEPAPPDTGNPDIWVLKLDSLGYDTITVGIKENRPFYDGSVQVYPNPVSGEFTLIIGNRQTEAEHTVVFYNIYGLKVREIRIPKGKQQVKINASNWKSGLYVAVVSRQGKVVGRKKFVVKR